jgi:hypothetical protein
VIPLSTISTSWFLYLLFHYFFLLETLSSKWFLYLPTILLPTISLFLFPKILYICYSTSILLRIPNDSTPYNLNINNFLFHYLLFPPCDSSVYYFAISTYLYISLLSSTTPYYFTISTSLNTSTRIPPKPSLWFHIYFLPADHYFYLLILLSNISHFYLIPLPSISLSTPTGSTIYRWCIQYSVHGLRTHYDISLFLPTDFTDPSLNFFYLLTPLSTISSHW